MDSKNDGNIDQCYRLLALCARATPHPSMDKQLVSCTDSFTAWDDLPMQAELHGMLPLLWYHLKRANIALPSEVQRTITGLYLRQRRWNEIYTLVLLEINSLFQNVGIRALVLKGLALAYEYYPDRSLRPLNDIDLLLHKDDILPALNSLKAAGFNVNMPLASPNYDLLPKELAVSSPLKNGLAARIELHHYDPRVRSMIDNSFDDEFKGFGASSHSLQVDESMIYVPDPMNTLDYLVKHFTRHMFVATNSSPLPLKWIADILCLVEQHAKTIDWDSHSALLNRLEVIYSLTPFPENLLDVIPIKHIQSPDGVNHYPQGWPQQVISDWKHGGFWNYIKHALASSLYIRHTLSSPSPWWLRMQYGIDQRSVFWYGRVVYRLQILKMAITKLMRRNQ